jgi:CheY-like chemotaxis protein
MQKHTLSNASRHKSVDRLSAIHILIIISSARAGDLIKRLFENLGFRNLYVVHNTTEAVQFLREIKVHLIVTDADLEIAPEHSKSEQTARVEDKLMQLRGIQFVNRLRYSPASPAPFVPVLMLMDHARSESILEARDAGVNEIVLKPLEARNFCERVIQMIDNPRPHITAPTYRGPCRRRNANPPMGVEERRVREIRLIRCHEMKAVRT